MLIVGEGRVWSDHDIGSGSLVAPLRGTETAIASWRSLQIDDDLHIEDLGELAYLNHSCRPNTFVDVVRRKVHAIRDIAAGDTLTFFYPSTEWEMSRPFPCWCAEPGCLVEVSGASVLGRALLERHGMAPHIARRVAQRDVRERIAL